MHRKLEGEKYYALFISECKNLREAGFKSFFEAKVDVRRCHSH